MQTMLNSMPRQNTLLLPCCLRVGKVLPVVKEVHLAEPEVCFEKMAIFSWIFADFRNTGWNCWYVTIWTSCPLFDVRFNENFPWFLPCFLKLEPEDSDEARAESGLRGRSWFPVGGDSGSAGGGGMNCSEWITSLLRDSINGTLFLSLLLCFLALFFDFLLISITSTLVSSIKVLGAGSGGVSPGIYKEPIRSSLIVDSQEIAHEISYKADSSTNCTKYFFQYENGLSLLIKCCMKNPKVQK